MYIKVRVTPGAKTQKITLKKQGQYEVWVKEPAERNLANMRVVELVAKDLGILPKRIRIVSGHTSPSKILSVLGGE